MDILERLLNWSGSLIVGSALIEMGMSRWNSRKFSWKFWWCIFLIAIGARLVLSGKIG